jgi:hypothetical protein
LPSWTCVENKIGFDRALFESGSHRRALPRPSARVTATPIPSQTKLQTVNRIEKDQRPRAKRLIQTLRYDCHMCEGQPGFSVFRDRHNRTWPGLAREVDSEDWSESLLAFEHNRSREESRLRPLRQRGSSLAELSMVSLELAVRARDAAVYTRDMCLPHSLQFAAGIRNGPFE